MARKPGVMTEDEFLKSVRIGDVPDAGPQIKRDYSPKGSSIPGLNDMVWESFTEGKTKVVAAPPGTQVRVMAELLKAKNYLNYIHRDELDENGKRKVDVRGVEKNAVQVVTEDDIKQMSAKDRTAYRKHVPIGWVGVRFKARPPLDKGRRVQQRKQREAATRPARAAQAVENGQGNAQAVIPAVKFSG